MFKKIPELSTDPKLEKDGIRVEIAVPQYDADGKELPSIEGWVLLGRAGGNNLRFAAAVKANQKPVKYQIEHDMLPPGKLREINRNILADGCVFDFGGFPDEAGGEVAYNEANARALLAAYSVVHEICATKANELAAYRAAEHNAAVDSAKNG